MPSALKLGLRLPPRSIVILCGTSGLPTSNPTLGCCLDLNVFLSLAIGSSQVGYWFLLIADVTTHGPEHAEQALTSLCYMRYMAISASVPLLASLWMYGSSDMSVGNPAVLLTILLIGDIPFLRFPLYVAA